MRIGSVGAVGIGFGMPYVPAINRISKSERLARIKKQKKVERKKKKPPLVTKPDWMGLYIDLLV